MTEMNKLCFNSTELADNFPMRAAMIDYSKNTVACCCDTTNCNVGQILLDKVPQESLEHQVR